MASSSSSGSALVNRNQGQQSLNRKHKWSLNFALKSKSDRQQELATPPGFNTFSAGQVHAEASREADPSLLVKKSWDIALGPLKQIPMNLFIMYMAGNSISIFPIMMVGMLFLRPVKALFTIQSVFKVIEGEQHLLQKFIYLLGNLAALAVALYKCQSMGLLPTHPSDWLDFVEPQQRLEFSGGGLQL
jgi:hypothetical protein